MTDITDQLRALARRYTVAWCSQDPACVAGFFSAEARFCVNEGAPAVGRAEITELARGFMTTFPDMVVRMDDLVVRADGAVYHWTLTGTNRGSNGTGRGVCISGFEEWTIGSDGLIARSQGHFDSVDYQRQLGAAP